MYPYFALMYPFLLRPYVDNDFSPMMRGVIPPDESADPAARETTT